MVHKAVIEGKKGVKVSFSFETQTFYSNCAINMLGQFNVHRVDSKPISQEDVDNAVDTLAFHQVFPDLGGIGGGPSAWVVSAGLTYATDYVDNKSGMRTAHVMAAMAKGKLGSWVSTPIYDNHAHPHADSLQVCMIWFPEQRVNHILTDRPRYHIPTSKIRKGMPEKWQQRTDKMRPQFPETLHRGVGMILKSFGWKGANPIEEVPVKAEKMLEVPISGWADIA